MSFLFNEVLYRPIFNALIFIHNFLPGDDFGLAIVVLTLIIRLIFTPFSIKAITSQRKMAAIQPKVKEIQEKFKHDKQLQAQKMMELYRIEKINPMSGCLPLIIQIPILFALYRAFLNGFNPENLKILYSFVQNPGVLNSISFGFLDLSVANRFLAILTGALQFIQSKISLSQQGSGEGANQAIAAMGKQMTYFFPFLIVVIGWNLPAGLLLYWLTTTVFSIGEQFYIKVKVKHV